jgi:acetyl esterase
MMTWPRFLFGAIAIVAVSFAACSAAERTVTYKKVGDVELQLHIFEPAGHQASDSTPAIVFFFGGGWVGGSPSQFFPHCEYLASRGMVAISADYRTKSKHGTSPAECVADGKSAIRWVRQHAKEIGVDPQRIAAGGGSAGGHVAAATGTLAKFDEASEDAAISSRPNALVLFNPVFDNGPEGYGHDRVKDYWQDFSPLHNISDQSPPTIVFLGSKDNLIPVATADDYKKRMDKAGVRCDVWIYAGQPHGFFNARGDRAYYHATVYQADKFLASIGYLKGEPTIENTKVEAEQL